MKNNIIRLFAISALALIVSCEPSDDGTGYQQLDRDFSPVNATIEIDSDLVVTELEEDAIIVPIKITLDREAPFKTYYSVEYEGSTLTEDVDFSGPHMIEVEEYTSTVIVDIVINSDCTFEETEFLTGTIGEVTTGNVNVTPVDFNITVENYVSPNYDFIFSWEGVSTVEIGGESVEVDLCAIADIDVYVLDSTGADTGIYDAATGDCPESIIVSPEWGDGVYELVASVYAFEPMYNGFDITGSEFLFDFSTDYSQCGTEDSDSSMLENIFTYSAGPGQDVGIATITIANGEITNIVLR